MNSELTELNETGSQYVAVAGRIFTALRRAAKPGEDLAI